MEKEILIHQTAINARVKELASRISADYEGKEPVFVGMLNGAVFFFADLVRELTIPVKIDFIRVASYGSGNSSSGLVSMTKGLEIPVKDKPVILVEDIVDTGLTLSKILGIISTYSPESIKICSLIDKKERREKDIMIDYCGFQVKEGFLVGYGMDYNEQFRCLRDIYKLHF
ncbi:MAG: hypoxanthine phosphoribosyltransferase [Deltaproteobacteria bacterium]|nr:hypoxanthine phosphoribosyltransferase [Deltaproteobacteria bacterium]